MSRKGEPRYCQRSLRGARRLLRQHGRHGRQTWCADLCGWFVGTQLAAEAQNNLRKNTEIEKLSDVRSQTEPRSISVGMVCDACTCTVLCRCWFVVRYCERTTNDQSNNNERKEGRPINNHAKNNEHTLTWEEEYRIFTSPIVLFLVMFIEMVKQSHLFDKQHFSPQFPRGTIEWVNK